jgi:Na+-transporting NADH:ubiquinone oxidoreductase subunit NqrA
MGRLTPPNQLETICPTMKFSGGYNIRLAGRPASRICAPDQPELLLLPQRSRRVRFNKLLVTNGQSVRCGQVLAIATSQFNLPLLAPMDGVVRLRVHRGHIQLESLRVGSPQISASSDVLMGHSDKR